MLYDENGLISVAKSRNRSNVLHTHIERLQSVLNKAAVQLGKYAKTGFFRNLITGMNAFQLFSDIDNEITNCFNEIPIALQITGLHEQAENFSVVKDIQSTLVNMNLSTVDTIVSNRKELQEVADMLGTDIYELRNDMQVYLNELKSISSNVEKNLNISEKNLNVSEKNLNFTEKNLNLNEKNLNISEEIFVKIVELSNEVRTIKQTSSLTTSTTITQEHEKLFSFEPTPVDSEDESFVIGEGSFGKVLRMKFSLDKRCYAVKQVKVLLLKNNGLNIKEIEKEADLLSQIIHPHIVRYFTQFYSKKNKYFNVVMELVDGGSLYEKVKENVDEKQLLVWFQQTVNALDYLHHSKNILHRDLKPTNVLLTVDNNIKIIDLGFFFFFFKYIFLFSLFFFFT
jgi:hypothetical protein